ncbi:MAG: hypothetical protein M1829_006530 [Trizodia sp. TS-e1964]|nr:MAG: hypothetical protein M1829_006530 [Trizodia sp. TS-e1964]
MNQQQENVRAVKGYAQKHNIEIFEIGSKVSIAISKLDRGPTDPKRIFGIIKAECPITPGNAKTIPIEISNYESSVSSYYSDNDELDNLKDDPHSKKPQETQQLAESETNVSPPLLLRCSTRALRPTQRYNSEEQWKENDLFEQELARLEATEGMFAPLWSKKPEFAGMTAATKAFEKGRVLRSQKAKPTS